MKAKAWACSSWDFTPRSVCMCKCGDAGVKQSRHEDFKSQEERRTWKEELPENNSCRNHIKANASRRKTGATICCQARMKMTRL